MSKRNKTGLWIKACLNMAILVNHEPKDFRDYEVRMTAAVTAKLSPTAMSDPFATPVQTRLSPRKILGWNERERDVEAETSVEDVRCESKWDYLSAGRFSSEPRVRPKRSVNSVTAY